jgi:hypothetical protein
VVEPAISGTAPITVTYGSAPADRAGRVLTATPTIILPPEWPDVAILDVPDAADSRCVVIDSGQVTRGTLVLTAGYPAKAKVPYQAQDYTAGEWAYYNSGRRKLRITGDVVNTGMSGSPVVNLESGFVCGILGVTKGPDQAVGGFATMFSDLVEEQPDLNRLNDQPPEAARAWLDVLDEVQLKNAGRDYSTGARWGAVSVLPRLDLEVEQGEQDLWGTWRISVRSSPAGPTAERAVRQISDLGDGVMRAVDSWSRRQTISLQDEVDVLGDVLHRAMLPEIAVSALAGALKGRSPLLRVCADNAPRLSRLPWEYACGDDHQPFAATKDMTFSRFVNVDDRSPDPKDTIKVLALIECPDRISKGLAEYRDENQDRIRPNKDAFKRTLRGDVLGKPERVQLCIAVNYTPSQLDDIFKRNWDIVHYIGFAVQPEGELQIALGGVQARRTVTVDELAGLLYRSRCSVFIAEFHKPPAGQDMEFPSDLSGLTSLLTAPSYVHPHALIVTQYPMTVVDLGRFNETFYERIIGGNTVEESAQLGRWEVRNQSHKGRDVAAFGSFMVTTTRPGEMRLLRSAQGPPRKETGPPPGPGESDQLPDAGEAFTGQGAKAREVSPLRAQQQAANPDPGDRAGPVR